MLSRTTLNKKIDINSNVYRSGRTTRSKMSSLKIEDSLVICGDDELKLFISYPDHAVILAWSGMDVGIKDPDKFPEPFESKYNLQIVESLLIQS